MFVCFFLIYYSIRYNPPFHAVTCRLLASQVVALGSIQCAAPLQAHVPVAPGAEVVGVPLVSGASLPFSRAEQGGHVASRDQGVMAAERGHQFDQGHSLAILIPRAG